MIPSTIKEDVVGLASEQEPGLYTPDEKYGEGPSRYFDDAPIPELDDITLKSSCNS